MSKYSLLLLLCTSCFSAPDNKFTSFEKGHKYTILINSNNKCNDGYGASLTFTLEENPPLSQATEIDKYNCSIKDDLTATQVLNVRSECSNGCIQKWEVFQVEEVNE
jgi:hypothetical protein